MAAATLQNKKSSINKGKLKKTIKNVLCRPDPLSWPEITIKQGKELESILCKYKVQLPEFKKQHWKELKLIPKEERPKPPKLQKVNGFLFGISECSAAIKNVELAAILIEATVNPQTIVQPIIEQCSNKIPIACMSGLRKTCAEYFGIPTSCLGIKKNLLQDVSAKVAELVEHKVLIQNPVAKFKTPDVKAAKEESATDTKNEYLSTEPSCPYLYRTNKKSRVFVPDSNVAKPIKTNEFISTNITKVHKEIEKKAYKKMIVKRISNNANRVKKNK